MHLDTPPPFRERVIIVDDWLREAAESAPMSPEMMDENEPAFWAHSSGTSGMPKAVIHAHRFARQIERVSAELLGVRADDRLFTSSKLFFAYPQTNCLFAGLKLGATVILDPEWPTARECCGDHRDEAPDGAVQRAVVVPQPAEGRSGSAARQGQPEIVRFGRRSIVAKTCAKSGESRRA